MSSPSIVALANFAHAWAAPELAAHLHVYKGSFILLEWYDAFKDDSLYISSEIPEEKVKQFCEGIFTKFL